MNVFVLAAGAIFALTVRTFVAYAATREALKGSIRW